MHKIREMLKEELKKYEGKTITSGSLDVMQKLTDTIKNIDKIEMLESEEGYSEMRDGYSRDGDWEARGSYGYNEGGNSYGRRGTHYVRGHYSRGDGYSDESSYRGGYSRESGKREMRESLEKLLHNASSDAERDAIRRCISELND